MTEIATNPPLPAADGRFEQAADGRWRLRFTRTLSHPLDKVWRAVTEPEHLAQWFPTTIEGERAAGAPLRFGFAEDRFPAFDGQMLAYEPPRLIEIQWGPDSVRIELEPDGEQATILTLLDTLQERGKGARDGTGWHTCLDALAAHLGGDPAARSQLETPHWKALNARYQQAFGPEASTIDPPEGHPVAD